jgi:uncharacterized protein YbjT (DUF2867 family)
MNRSVSESDFGIGHIPSRRRVNEVSGNSPARTTEDDMTTPILVTGGTGNLGSLIVARLRAAGHGVRVLSRRERARSEGVEPIVGDLATGEGVAAAVAGSRVIVHCAGSATGDSDKARILVDAARRSGTVEHLVYISVVGADTTPVVSRVDRALLGYFAAKRHAELIVAGSGLPWTTLRSTQFHDFIFETAAKLAGLPVVPSFAGFRYQPVAAAEVADELVELALGPAAGVVPDIAGPRIYPMEDLLRNYLTAAGRADGSAALVGAGRAAAAQRGGVNLAPHRAVGSLTWEEFLAARLG